MAYGKTPKTKTSYWIENDRLRESENNLRLAGCGNKSEYMNKALKHYNDYLHAKDSEDYLVKKMSVAVKLAFENMENRIGRNQFKGAVELSKVSKLMAPLCGMDKKQMEKLHIDSVNEVKHLNGFLTYDENVEQHRKENL